MADMVTAQELENAKIDVRTAGEAVNENKIVTPRYGAPFKSMPMIAEEMQGILGVIIAGGVPASIVLDASGKTQQEINIWNYDVVDFDIYNTPERYGASVSKLDNTVELQAWLDSSPLLHLRPFKTYKFSGKLSLTIQNQSIIGLTHQKYGQSILLFEGSGTAIDTPSNLEYLYFQGWQLKSKINTLGAVFDVGTKGLELKNGSVLEANQWFCSNFETLVESDGNSFYNKFNLCRFGDTRDALKDFAAYNLEITSCRFNRFTNALSTRTSGDVKMQFNSFERFNGYFHTSIGGTVCNLSFLCNYVETFSNELMPVNFLPATQSQDRGAYWGGNTLFTGNYFSFSCEKNQLTIDGVFRILSAFTCDHIHSDGNGIAVCITGNNLERMFFVTSGSIKSVHINDIKSGSLSRDGGYARTYLNFNPSQIANVRNRYYYYDCISDAAINLPAKQATATLLNGWVGQTGGFNVATATKILANDDGSTSICGVVTGASKTDNIILNIPLALRPEPIGTTQIRVIFYSYALSNNPTVNDLCVLSYEYSSGNLSLAKNLGSLVDIPLNLSIPARL